MKKLLVVLLIAIVAVALVACGGNDTTTKAPEGTTGGTDTTTDSGEDTEDTEDTEAPGTTVAPLYSEGVDILYGDIDNCAINEFWYNSEFPIAFENHHADLDYNWSIVMQFRETPNMIWETLVITDDTDPDDVITMINNQYTWIFTIDGKDYEIQRFSFYSFITSGYIRCDLGPDFEVKPSEDEDDANEYEVSLKIVEKGADTASTTIAYWADFCAMYPFEFVTPAPVVMVPDANRDPNHVALGSAEAPALVGDSGPAGFSSETYDNLFDENVRTKLCTDDIENTTVTFHIADLSSAPHIVSYSLVGANDDVANPGRFISNFKLYSSSTGAADSWVLIDEVNLGEDVGTIVNYGERNYKLDSACTDHYFKLEITATGLYQLSGIILYTEN